MHCMRRSPGLWHVRAIVGLVALVVLPEEGAHGQDRLAVAEEVRQREIAFAQTMADRDHDVFVTFLSPEAVFFNGDTPIRGAAAVAAAWAPLFEGTQAPFSWYPEVVEVLESGDLALTSGPVRGPGGEVVGRFNSVWRRDARGVWRVIFDKGCS